MGTDRDTRKLRAILSADVKGYSLLMTDDEAHTIQTLKLYRDLMSDLIQNHSGRVVDNPGDNLLAEFSSAVNAVDCAIQIQKKLKMENTKFVENKRLQFRIGINVGDVVEDGDRIYGEGVNIAARIESLADAGGLCISRNTYEHIKKKLDLDIEYLGEHQVKNIKEPVRVYKVLLDTDDPKPLVEEKLELPDKPSIAVLPFTNMSGDPSQEYFSDGLTEQITNGLCKVSNLFVIARNSSFAYKGKSVSVKQIAKELGVRYILEGSVQKAGNRVRITAQLIDAMTDYHMWSENYDRDLEDIFALQDEITMKLINVMEVHLTFGEQARLWAGHTTSSIKAYDKLWRAVEISNRLNNQDNIQARRLAEEAIKYDSGYAFAYVVLGFTYMYEVMSMWTNKPVTESFEQAKRYAVKAIEIADSLDYAHTFLGLIYLASHQHDKAIEEHEMALSLNPNGADTLVFLANTYGYSGESTKAIELIKKAFRLNPFPSSWYYLTLCTIFHMNKEYQDAISTSVKCISIAPDLIYPYLYLAASYATLGNVVDAKDSVAEILRINPNFSIDVAKLWPYKYKSDLDHLLDGLRKAGLPEHSPE